MSQMTLWERLHAAEEELVHLRKQADCAEAELTRLRGIEAAVIEPIPREEAIERWRELAGMASEEGDAITFAEIADALEAKP